MKNFSKDELKNLIRFKYGSLTRFAAVLGISKQALDGKINRPSYPFVRQLIEQGVITDVQLSDDERLAHYIASGTGQSDMVVLQNVKTSGNITVTDKNVTDEVCKSCDTRKMLETQIEQLREIIKAKDELISLLKK